MKRLMRVLTCAFLPRWFIMGGTGPSWPRLLLLLALLLFWGASAGSGPAAAGSCGGGPALGSAMTVHQIDNTILENPKRQ